MLQVLPKWCIVFSFEIGETVTLYMSDNFYSNVLRKVSEIEFSKHVVKVTIERFGGETNQVTSVTSNLKDKGEY